MRNFSRYLLPRMLLGMTFLAVIPAMAESQQAAAVPAAIPTPAPSQQAAATPAAVPAPAASLQSATAPYVVGVADFSSEGLPASADLFAFSLPRLIASELSMMPPRHDDDAYLAETTALAAARQLYDAGAELSARLDDLALRSLEPGIEPYRRSQNLNDAAQKVDAATKKIAVAGIEDSSAAARARQPTRPSSLWKDNQDGKLIAMDPSGPLATIRGKKIDLIVYGSLEAMDDYLAIDVHAFDGNVSRDLFSTRVYAAPTDPAPVARDIADRLCAIVAGRPYGRVDFSVSPDSTVINVDGDDLPSSKRRVYVFDAESLSVQASAPGCDSLDENLDVGPADRKIVTIKLQPSSTGSAVVTTAPSGLPVAINGFPMGPSPVTVPLNGMRSIAAAWGPDKAADQKVVPASGQDNVKLVPRDPSTLPSASIDRRRDEFYAALGLFVISLPPTTLSYGLMNQYYDAYYRSGNASMASNFMAAEIALGVFGVASAGLAVYAIIRLIRYVSAAN